jgi:hypothetical protein
LPAEIGRVVLPAGPEPPGRPPLVRAEEPVKPPFAERKRGVDVFEEWPVEPLASIDLSFIPS